MGKKERRSGGNQRIVRVVDNSDNYNHFVRRTSPGNYTNRGFHGVSHGRGRGGRGFSQMGRGYRKAVQMIRDSAGPDGDLDMSVEQEIWCKITIMFGSSYMKEWLYGELSRLLGMAFAIVNFRTEGKNALFFVKIRRSDLFRYRTAFNKLISPDGDRVNVNVVQCSEPSLPTLTEDITSKLKEALVTRFDIGSSSLNLSALCKDIFLLNHGIYMPLNRGIIITNIVQILTENLTQLNAINLSKNRLDTLVAFTQIFEKFKMIRSIDLSENNFRNVSSIDSLRHVNNLEDLDLTNNPISRKFPTIERLGSHLRERIPGISRLNQKSLQTAVQFEIQKNEAKAAPPCIQGYFPSAECQTPLLAFVKSYFELYDGEKQRQQLLAYYSDQSVFTLSWANNSQNVQNTGAPASRFHSSYLYGNLNLFKMKDGKKRHQQVKTGKLRIVAYLDELPQTQHVLESLAMDVVFASDSYIMFNITGVYFEIEIEGKTRNKTLRNFSRTLIILPPQIIVQDYLFVTNPGYATCKKHMNREKPTPSFPSTSSIAAPTPVAPVSQEQMVAEFTKMSGMKPEYSHKCLEDCNWDYQTAAISFTNLKQQGKIPPEAFL